MGLRVFDFRCPEGHVTEHFVGSDYMEGDAVQCAHRDTPVLFGGLNLSCGKPAYRQPSAPRAKLEGITGAFPGAADKWVRNRESKMAQEKKNLKKHGSYR